MPNQADFPPPDFSRWGMPQKPKTKRGDTLVIYKGRGAKPWRFRHVAGNGEIIAQGQAYTRKADATRGARRAVPGVPIR